MVFTSTTTNNGPGTAKAANLNDPLPTGTAGTWTITNQPAGNPCQITGTFPAQQTLSCVFGDLPAGASRAVTVSAPTISQANPPVDACKLPGGGNRTYDNEVTVTSDNQTPVTDDASVVCNSPDLTVVKTGNSPINAGENVVFTSTTTNNGPGTAKAANLNDPLPTGTAGTWTITNQPAGNPCQITGTFPAQQTLSCVFGDLPAGASRAVTVSAPTISQANPPVDACKLPGGGNRTYDNEVTVTSDNQTPVTDDASVVCNSPDLTVVKTGNSPINAGENVVFTSTTTNNGPGTAKAANLNDPLPTGTAGTWTITNQPAGNPCQITGTFPAQQTLSCVFGDLPAGASRAVTVSAPTISQANPPVDACKLPGGGNRTYDNEVTVTSDNQTPVTDDASVVCNSPDLTVVKTGNSPINAGENVVFTSTTTNNGPGTAKAANLNDPLPTGTAGTWTITNQPAGNPCQITGTFPAQQTLSCVFGDLPAGASRAVTVSAPTISQANPPVDACKLPGGGNRTYDNEVTVTSDNQTPVTDDASVVCNSPDLTVVKTGNSPINAGENVVFTSTTTNNGPGTAKAANLNDPLPTGTAGTWTITNQPAGNPCQITGTFPAQQTLSCVFGDLPAGASRAVTVSAPTISQANPPVDACKLPGGGNRTYDNEVTVTSDNQTPVTDDASVVCNSPDLTVVKTGNSPINAGENVVFTSTTTNNGPGTAKAANLNDPLPTGTAGTWTITNQPAGNPCQITGTFPAQQTLSCVFGDLPAGASRAVTVSAPTISQANPPVDACSSPAAATAPTTTRSRSPPTTRPRSQTTPRSSATAPTSRWSRPATRRSTPARTWSSHPPPPTTAPAPPRQPT